MKKFQILLYNFYAIKFVNEWIISPDSYPCDLILRHGKALGSTVVETSDAKVAMEIKEEFQAIKFKIIEIKP